MAVKPGARTLTDAEILGDDNEEEGSGVELEASANAEEGVDEHIAGGEERRDANANGAEEFEVVIYDGSGEGETELHDGGGEQAGDGALELNTEDAGELVDTAEGLTEWEKKHYSEAMQKRVLRERRQKIAERTARVDAVNKLAASEAERIKAQKEALDAQKITVALMMKAIDGDIASRQALLKKAKEDGNTDDDIRLQGELDDLRAKRREAETVKEGLDKTAAPRAAATVINPVQSAWLARNSWFNKPEFSSEANYARLIDKAISDEKKLTPMSPEYYAELDKRIAEKIPALKGRVRTAAKPAPRRTGAPSRVIPTTRTASGAAAQAGRKTKVVLDKDDFANMERFGIDRNDPKQVQEYARNKMMGG